MDSNVATVGENMVSRSEHLCKKGKVGIYQMLTNCVG